MVRTLRFAVLSRAVLGVSCLCGVLTGAMPADCKVVYVKPSGSDTYTGLSWSAAKKTIQAALGTAVASDEVWVAAGTYVQAITLKNQVGLYGGFVGTETLRTQRNARTNVTTINGNQVGSAVTVPTGSTTATVIDGFTITNGKGTLYSTWYYGGGVYCASTAATISNNIITGNQCTGSYSSVGGGIYVSGTGAVISNNTITKNGIRPNGGSRYGGGIACGNGSPTISGNTISANDASVTAGGIYINTSTTSNPVITSNVIKDNTLYGIYCETAASPTISLNKIIGNLETGIMLRNCTSTSKITNNIIKGNHKRAIILSGVSATVANNVIVGNDCLAYGAITMGDCSAGIYNNTIIGNGGDIGFPSGMAIFCNGTGSPIIKNNIIAYNTAGIYKESTSTPILGNNCVYGNLCYNYSASFSPDPTWLNGNMGSDPMLASSQYGNIHIQPGSPCANGGDNSVVIAGLLDYDGQTRIQAGVVDIGADETDGVTTWGAGPYGVVRVSTTGNDAYDGSTWATAKKTVRAAIDAASEIGGEVWVKAGTYTPANTDECILLRPYAYLYGGFNGSETTRSQRNWTTNASVLNGGALASTVNVKAGYMTSCVDGFVITNGTPHGTINQGGGGGINSFLSSLTIANNKITGNTVVSGPVGIYCGGGGSVITGNILYGNTFTGTGQYDTGISLSVGGGSNSSSPTLVTNNVINDTTIPEGIHCRATAAITNNTVASPTFIGIYCEMSTPSVTNNIVTGGSWGIHGSQGYSPSARNNCLFGQTGAAYSYVQSSGGDVFADPLFVNAGARDFRLSAASPCIDAGWNSATGLPTIDIAGNARMRDGNGDYNAVVDMGAYEY